MMKLFVYLFFVLFTLTFQVKAEDIKLNCNYESTFQNDKIVVKEKNKGNVLSFVYDENTKDVKSYPYEFIAKGVIFLKGGFHYDVSWMFKLENSDKFKYSYSFQKDRYSGIFFKGELRESFYDVEEKRIIMTNYYECEKSIY